MIKAYHSLPLVLPMSDTQISHCMPGIGPPRGGTTPAGPGPPHEHTHTHTHTHTSHSVGLTWTNVQNSTRQQGTTFTRERYPRTPAGFEPVFPAIGRPHTPTLDRVAYIYVALYPKTQRNVHYHPIAVCTE
jgi:hypothetical protein